LGISFSDFTSNTTAYSSFISQIASLLGKSSDQVDINSITQAKDGTVIINGSVAVENNNDTAINSAEDLYNQITNNPNALSWPVIHLSTAGMYGDVRLASSPSAKDSSTVGKAS
jgi:hypothetical protein